MRLWPFRRKTSVLTDESLDRAIRAGVQFELSWFLEQPPEVQEVIARRRDRWLEDVTLAAGFAFLDPERVQLGLAAEDGDDEAEAVLAGLNAVDIARAMGHHAAQEAHSEPGQPTRPTMSGLGKRRQAAEDEREAGRRKGSLETFGAREKTA